MRKSLSCLMGVVMLLAGGTARADDERSSACRDLPSHAALRAQLEAARAQANGGFNLDMWATVVNRDGIVCAVAFTGNNRGDQWPGSRVISAQKANTANAFSLPTLALSTADLFTATQPGGSLFGLQESNPVDTGVAFRRQSGEQRSKQRSDGRRTDRRRERIRRRLALPNPTERSSAESASAATRRARITTSPGGRATP